MAVHKELITSGKFDPKFKRALLDYYSYGFKNLGSYDARQWRTITEDWMRLNRVLADYLEWSEKPGEIMFAATDSQAMEENPFHRVYRFCKYKPITYPSYFLLTMAALSKEISLRGAMDSLGGDGDRLLRIEDSIARQGRLKTSDLLYFFTPLSASVNDDEKNRTPNNRLDDLAQIGLVRCEQSEGEKGGRGDRHWSLPELTMNKILDAGSCIDEGFERHLRSALDFYSKYYLFGEVGTFLLDRMENDEVSPFRFKHEYFMQSLNDFNLIDLLYAMENGKWCRIRYRHGIAGFETELLCYPLEIRVSHMGGREFLMYYEPFRRSYTALRLEFIESMEYYDDKKIKAVLSQTGHHPDPATVDSDIANARQAMKHLWGVSATKIQDRNAVGAVQAHTVSMQVAYDKESEYYIENRLRRECRFGTVSVADDAPYLHFRIDVSDEAELQPWLRSFYSRIMACDGMDNNHFCLKSDVESIVELLQHGKLMQPGTNSEEARSSIWEIPDIVKEKLGNGAKAREHDLLFNEVFGIYYYLIADVFTQLSAGGEGESYTEAEIDGIISSSFNKFYLKIGQETENLLPDEIKELLLSGPFMEETEKTVKKKDNNSFFRRPGEKVKSYISRYQCNPGLKWYRDVVPLTVFELRWLMTILDDRKLGLFMSEAEADGLRRLLKEHVPWVQPVPMDKVVFFDRFHFPEKNTGREAAALAALLEGIYGQRTVRIKYHTMGGRVITGEFKPIIIEYSQRNNRFQGFFQECGSDRIYTMNISRIETVEATDTVFDHALAQQALIQFREENMVSVEVEFYPVKNIVDRILTEFSPWKKRCSYDAGTGLFKLTIFYQKPDELDLVARLLGYGADLRFVDKEHAIYKEIKARMDRQMELFFPI